MIGIINTWFSRNVLQTTHSKPNEILTDKQNKNIRNLGDRALKNGFVRHCKKKKKMRMLEK